MFKKALSVRIACHIDKIDDNDATDITSASDYDNLFIATTYALDLHHDISMIEGW